MSFALIRSTVKSDPPAFAEACANALLAHLQSR